MNKNQLLRLHRLFQTEKYSDLTVICGQKSYAVHKALLCSRSSFFDAACGGRFREAHSGIIDLSEDDPESVKHMINCKSNRHRYTGQSLIAVDFYKLDYLTSSVETLPTPASLHRRNAPKKLNLSLVEDPLLATAAALSPATPPLISDASSPVSSPSTANSPVSATTPDWTIPSKPLLSPASSAFRDDFNIASPTAKSSLLALQRLDLNNGQAYGAQFSTNLVAHARVYAIAEKYDIEGLKALAKWKFATEMNAHHHSAEVPDAIAEVYESTVESDRGLRDVVIQTVRTHPEMVRRADVEDVIKDVPSLAYELFRVGWGLPIVGCQ
jgi:BTB/POZ domain